MAFQGDSIYWVEVEKVVPNPFQPRREFDVQKLKELSESIKMYGVMQPLTVTRNEIQREDGTFYTEYELIAGERRLRASKLAELTQVLVIIREGDDSEQEKLELAIIENLQREDLNAVDRALAFKQLAETFGLSHTLVAKKVGRSREYVSNSIRLLALPDYMLSALKQGEMTEGHGRTLLMLNDKPEEQDVVFREILLKKLSVREVERIVRKIATDKVRKKNPDDIDAELIEMEKRFMETLGTRVQIQKTDYGGKLTIDYFSVGDLEEMLASMKAEHMAKIGQNEQSEADVLTSHTPLMVDFDSESVKENNSNEDILPVTNSPEPVFAEKEKDVESGNYARQVVEPVPESNTVLDSEKQELEPAYNKDTEIPSTQDNFRQNHVEQNHPEHSHVAKQPSEVEAKPELNIVQDTEPELLPEKEQFVKLDSPLRRPQIVAHSHYKSPVYIQPAKEDEEQMVDKESMHEAPKDIPREPHVQQNFSAQPESVKTTPEPIPEQPIAGPDMTVKPQVQADDSGLYSMRNFGV